MPGQRSGRLIPMALDSTYKGTAADSYVDNVAEAETIAGLLASISLFGVDATAFLAADSTLQEEVLKLAADRIDQSTFIGDKATSNQNRAWPRVHTNRVSLNDPGTYPDAVKRAQVAEACALLTAQNEATGAKLNGVQSYTIDEQSVTFAAGQTGPGSVGAYSIGAENILRGAGLIQSGVASVYVPRG